MTVTEDIPAQQQESSANETSASPVAAAGAQDHAASTTADYAPLAAKDAEPYDVSGHTETQKATTDEPDQLAQSAHLVQDEQDEPPAPILPPRPAHDETVPTEVVGPDVTSLQAMFPDFDVETLQSVLQSMNGDQERAADVLLGMSDPNYESQHHSQAEQTVPMSQTELDEQFARRLVLEEQQAQASWHPDQQYPHGPQQGQRGYQARAQPGGGQAWNAPWSGGQNVQQQQQQQQQGGSGRDTMTEVQEQFSKIAETGKKTFSSLMTKVKAKMQEFDQNRNASNSVANTQPSWGSGTPSNDQPQSSYQSPYQTQTYQPPPQPPLTTQPGLERAASSERSISVGGYDATPQPSISPPPASSVLPSGERIPPRPGSTGPPPAGNVDPSKIGMLPKRQVSLLGTSTQSNTAATGAARDDDDDLEYVENPFEEGRK